MISLTRADGLPVVTFGMGQANPGSFGQSTLFGSNSRATITPTAASSTSALGYQLAAGRGGAGGGQMNASPPGGGGRQLNAPKGIGSDPTPVDMAMAAGAKKLGPKKTAADAAQTAATAANPGAVLIGGAVRAAGAAVKAYQRRTGAFFGGIGGMAP